MNSKLKAIRKENGFIIAWLEGSPITIMMPTPLISKSYVPSYHRYPSKYELVDMETEHVFIHHLPKEFRE